jgi:hypothetical protein
MVDRRHGFYSCRQFHAGVPVPVLELITLVESDPTLQPYPYQRLLDWLLAAHVVPARPAAWRSLSQSRCAEDAAAFVDDTLPRLLKRPPRPSPAAAGVATGRTPAAAVKRASGSIGRSALWRGKDSSNMARGTGLRDWTSSPVHRQSADAGTRGARGGGVRRRIMRRDQRW